MLKIMTKIAYFFKKIHVSNYELLVKTIIAQAINVYQ
jgi:hypothetical protein